MNVETIKATLWDYYHESAKAELAKDKAQVIYRALYLYSQTSEDRYYESLSYAIEEAVGEAKLNFIMACGAADKALQDLERVRCGA